MTKFNDFLNTAFGSWSKIFITTILVQYMASGKGIFELDWTIFQTFINSAVASLLPVVINYLNPADVRYGKDKKV